MLCVVLCYCKVMYNNVFPPPHTSIYQTKCYWSNRHIPREKGGKELTIIMQSLYVSLTDPALLMNIDEYLSSFACKIHYWICFYIYPMENPALVSPEGTVRN